MTIDNQQFSHKFNLSENLKLIIIFAILDSIYNMSDDVYEYETI